MPTLTVIQGGRSAAQQFEALVRPHYDVLYRAAYRLTRSVPDAEDLVQEVCTRAYPRLDELDQLDNPRAWLLCVMQRLFIDETRRYERRHVQSIETTSEESFASEELGVAEQVDRAISSRRLDLAWRRLPKDQRALLALHDIEGYSLAELMQITGLKEGTLKSRLHRARVKLGKLLQHEQNADTAAELGAAL
jgi:RNA polymerase sigma-70 factor (ECF subfamily)